ncbi:MAG: SRPBCC domain-containing protein [Prevotella sp.]|nr:SRPBCC domain-containing protein [Prevotella sp.]
MKKLEIEYPLATNSPTIIWELISSAHGLERWLADHVTEEDGLFTIIWGEPWTQQDIREARVIECVKNERIRLKWQDDDDDSTYWEMRIEQTELTGQQHLLITDFAEDGDFDGLQLLWDDNLNRLHRASGL